MLDSSQRCSAGYVCAQSMLETGVGGKGRDHLRSLISLHRQLSRGPKKFIPDRLGYNHTQRDGISFAMTVQESDVVIVVDSSKENGNSVFSSCGGKM